MIPAVVSGAPDPGPPSPFFQDYNILLVPAYEPLLLQSNSYQQAAEKLKLTHKTMSQVKLFTQDPRCPGDPRTAGLTPPHNHPPWAHVI